MTQPHPSYQCQCKAPGYCEFFQRDQSLKDFKLCRGEAGTQEQQQEQKKLWAESVPLPPLTQQATNFAQSMLDFAKSGLELVDDEVHRIRVQTCRDCLLVTDNLRCRACGCWVEKKAKIKSEECPHNFWPKVSSSQEETVLDVPIEQPPEPQFVPAKNNQPVQVKKKRGCPCSRKR